MEWTFSGLHECRAMERRVQSSRLAPVCYWMLCLSLMLLETVSVGHHQAEPFPSHLGPWDRTTKLLRTLSLCNNDWQTTSSNMAPPPPFSAVTVYMGGGGAVWQ